MESWDLRTLDIEPHKPQVLLTAEEARAIVINLPSGEELQEHQTHEAAFLVVVDGEVDIEQDGGSTSGGPGLFAHFPANERRRVIAKADTRLLLVLGPWPGQGHPRRRT